MASAQPKSSTENSGQAGTTGTNGFRLQLFSSAISHHPIAFAVILVVSAVAAAGIWFFLPLPKLTGAVVYRISAQPPALLAPVHESKVEFVTYKTNQAGLVKQRLVLNGALKELANRNQMNLKELPALAREAEQLPYLEQKVQVDFKLAPELMRVAIEGDDEGELLKILEAIDLVYLQKVHELDNGARDARKKTLEKRLVEYEDMLKVLRQDLARYANMLNSTSPGVLSNLEDLNKLRLQQLSADIVRNERSLELAQQELDRAQGKLKTAKEVDVSATLVDQALRSDEGVLIRENAIKVKKRLYDDLDDQLKDKSHLSLLKAKRELDEATKELDRYREERRPVIAATVKQRRIDEFTLSVARCAEQVDFFVKSKAALTKEYDDFKNEIKKQSQTYMLLENTKLDINRIQTLREQILREVDQLELEGHAPNRVVQSEKPYVMSGLEGNRRLKTAVMASAGVILAGIVGLVFWESRNRRVLAIDDVAKSLGLKVFGTVPPIGSDKKACPIRESALVEAIDTARTMLLYADHLDQRPKTVLITSASPGEGKSSLSSHLAISLTRAGFRTLLIDGDMRNPTAHLIYGTTEGPGLSEYLRAESNDLTMIQSTSYPGLEVLPAGRWSVAATQALAGGRWTTLRAAVESSYDFVIIDSPPILPVVDALLLARNVDGVLLSVMNKHSKVSNVAESQHRLVSIGANLMGVVVNGIESKGGKYGYGYPYGHSVPSTETNANVSA